jgi:hypothetical protein
MLGPCSETPACWASSSPGAVGRVPALPHRLRPSGRSSGDLRPPQSPHAIRACPRLPWRAAPGDPPRRAVLTRRTPTHWDGPVWYPRMVPTRTRRPESTKPAYPSKIRPVRPAGIEPAACGLKVVPEHSVLAYLSHFWPLHMSRNDLRFAQFGTRFGTHFGRRRRGSTLSALAASKPSHERHAERLNPIGGYGGAQGARGHLDPASAAPAE